MKRGVALGLVFVLSLEWSGCATLNAPLMDSCRGSDGRFAVCPSGGGGVDGLLVGLGIAGALGLIAGISYLATRSSSTQSTTAPAPQAPAPLRGSATHRCRAPNGEESDFAADQPCAAAAGYVDAPGRLRQLYCCDRIGLAVATTGTSCAAAGLASTPN